jgi:hypothetical protein
VCDTDCYFCKSQAVPGCSELSLEALPPPLEALPPPGCKNPVRNPWASQVTWFRQALLEKPQECLSFCSQVSFLLLSLESRLSVSSFPPPPLPLYFTLLCLIPGPVLYNEGTCTDICAIRP